MEQFIVSARKYRPATFASVVGQKHITSTLKNAIERNQLAHAYLFCGPRGVGKTTCARIFAKAINCLNPSGAEACNECESCRSFNENRSLNIHELDAASNNSVDDIRTLIEQVRIIPQVGRYSVFIIDEVHMLSQAAFNAFLKTLEEPPAHAIFILATTEKHKIIPTILSRCQIYDFNRIRVEDSVEYLKYIAAQEGVGYDDESLNLIAQKADGGMRDALSMFDKAVSFCGQQLDFREVAQTLNVLDYDTYFRLTDMLLGGDYRAALLEFDAVLAKGFSAQTFVAGLNRHMRDLLVARDAATLRLIEMTGTLLERYRSQAGRCDTEFLFGGMSLLTEADGKLRLSSNQRLLVELTMMKLAGMGQKKNSVATEYPLADITANTQNQSVAPVPQSAVQPAVGTPQQGDARPEGQPVQQPQPVQPAVQAGREQQPQTDSVRQTADDVRAAQQANPQAVSPAPQPVQPRPSDGMPTPPAMQSAAQPQPEVKQPVVTSQTRRPLVSGTSLAALLGDETADDADEQTDGGAVRQADVDPDSERKLEAARDAIFGEIRQRRPRFVAAFDGMTFSGATIRLRVPSQALGDEIMRSKLELLTRVAELADVKGALELDVTVDESIKASKPIKLEDRVKFITEKNPLVNELRRTLDLDVE